MERCQALSMESNASFWVLGLIDVTQKFNGEPKQFGAKKHGQTRST